MLDVKTPGELLIEMLEELFPPPTEHDLAIKNAKANIYTVSNRGDSYLKVGDIAVQEILRVGKNADQGVCIVYQGPYVECGYVIELDNAKYKVTGCVANSHGNARYNVLADELL
jgi:hypothetical protein